MENLILSASILILCNIFWFGYNYTTYRSLELAAKNLDSERERIAKEGQAVAMGRHQLSHLRNEYAQAVKVHNEAVGAVSSVTAKSETQLN